MVRIALVIIAVALMFVPLFGGNMIFALGAAVLWLVALGIHGFLIARL